MSARYTQGMSGIGEAIVWTVHAPAGVDFTTASSIALSAAVAGKTTRYLTAWVLVAQSATRLQATFIPTGAEFPSAESVTIRPTLTVDGVAYRYPKMTETVDPN